MPPPVQISSLVVAVALLGIIFAKAINNIISKTSFIPIATGPFHSASAFYVPFLELSGVHSAVSILILTSSFFVAFCEFPRIFVSILVHFSAVSMRYPIFK